MTNGVVKEFKMMRDVPWWQKPLVYASIVVAVIEGSGYAVVILGVLAAAFWFLYCRAWKYLVQTYNLLVIRDLCEEIEKHGTSGVETCLNKYEDDKDES